MNTITNEAELEAIKQEFKFRTEQLLRLTNTLTVTDVKNREVLAKLRRAQIAYNDVYIKLVYFIDKAQGM